MLVCVSLLAPPTHLLAQLDINPPNPPIAPTHAECIAYSAARMQIYRQLGAKCRECFNAHREGEFRIGWATDRFGKKSLMAFPKCQPLINQKEAFHDETMSLLNQCIEEADRKKDREATVQTELRRARELADKARGIIDVINNPVEYFTQALRDKSAVDRLLPKEGTNFAEANEIYRLTANFARYGISKQRSPIIRSIQSDQLERIIKFHSEMMLSLAETERQMGEFIIVNQPRQTSLPPPRISSPSVACSILRDPARSQALLQSDAEAWQRLVEACENRP